MQDFFWLGAYMIQRLVSLVTFFFLKEMSFTIFYTFLT